MIMTLWFFILCGVQIVQLVITTQWLLHFLSYHDQPAKACDGTSRM